MAATSYVTIICLLVATGAVLVSACGVTTHNVIAHRAASFAPAALDTVLSNQDAFQNGAAFPDFGYDCPLKDLHPQLPSMSEAAHWPPFQNATIQYILQNQASMGENETNRMVAFLLGVTSHAVADILWHDLEVVGARTQQGFIQAFANFDFSAAGAGYSGDAHTAADDGGEFMAAYQTNLEFLLDHWYLPSAALSEIFVSLGYRKLSAGVIEDCNALLFGEVQGVKDVAGRILYPHFANDTPWIVDNYQDYWIGGINDMATWTHRCWPFLVQWLVNGKPGNDSWCLVESQWGWTPPTKSLLEGEARARAHTEMAIHRTLKKMLRDMGAWPINVRRTRTAHGVLFERSTSSPPAHNTIFSPADTTTTATPTPTQPTPPVPPPRTPPTPLPTPPPTAPTPPPTTPPPQQFCSTVSKHFSLQVDQAYAYLGKSMAVGDVNGDGMDDIVLGAPGWQAEHMPQAGAAFILYGSNSANAAGDVDLSAALRNRLRTPSGESIQVLQGTETGAHFGSAMQLLDFNVDGALDLIVSAPGVGSGTMQYTGSVYVFLNNRATSGPTFGTKPSIIIACAVDFTNLGMSLSACDVNDDGFADLLVGSPMATGGRANTSYSDYNYQVGALSIFLAADTRQQGQQLDWMTDADWSRKGEQMYEWFGYSTACLAGKFLFVSSPEMTLSYTNGTEGKVSLFSLASPSRLALFQSQIYSMQKSDQFGVAMATGDPYGKKDKSSYLVVSVPSRTYGIGFAANESSEGYHQLGSVLILNTQQLTNNSTLRYEDAMTTFIPSEEFGRFGWDLHVGDLTGDGIDDVWISQPNARSKAGREAGGGYLWKGGPKFPVGRIVNATDTADYCFQASTDLAFYGRVTKFLDWNSDGEVDMLIAGPSDWTAAPQAGGVKLVLSPFAHL